MSLVTDQPKVFTGLVVDARGTGAKSALTPRILNENGDEAYSVAYIESAAYDDQGIVLYVTDLSSAKTHPRVAPSPMIVKAIRAEGTSHADLVISNSDAQSIHGVPDNYRFLEKGRVVVLLDKE